MIRCVSAVVRVIPHITCGVVIAVVMNENGVGRSSPGCMSTAFQSMVRPSSRGGVPVFSRPITKPRRASVSPKPMAGFSPTRPAGVRVSPIWIRPRRKVPVVMTTAPAASVRPSPSRTPVTCPPAIERSSTSPSITVRPATSRSRSWTAWR